MFTPIENKRVFQHVVEQIQQMIFSGDLNIGDKLPSERDLCVQLSVGRTSVREALRALEVTGLIESRQGEGNFISGSMQDSLLKPMSAMFMLNKGTPRDLLELRKTIEVTAARLAAERVNDRDAKKLIQILDDFSQAGLEANKAELDKDLHYFIAEMTGNVLIINILAVISNLMEIFVQTSRLKILENPNNQRLLFKNHEDIAEAIIAGDADAAAKAMTAHMQMIEDIVRP